MLYRQISLFAKIRNQMPKSSFQVSGFAKILFSISFVISREYFKIFSKRVFESVDKISLNKVNVRKFSDFGKIGDCQPLLQNEPKRWSLWSNRVGQRSYHVLPQISPRAGARRSLHLTSAKWKAIKTKMNRIGRN